MMSSSDLAHYRDSAVIKHLLSDITSTVTRKWRIMEICGGQTHAILRYGLDQLLPHEIEFLHGPGCPVCVTAVSKIDTAIAIAAQPDVVFCSLGDMLRVPGSGSDLFKARAAGADVRVLYSPLGAVKIARENPEQQVVYFAIGFETTAPLNALTILQAHELCLENFSVLSAQVLVPPAIEMILNDPGSQVDALLAAGHVCTIMGYQEYESISAEHNLPIAITGFEPVDILRGVLSTVRQLETGEAKVDNQYTRAVSREGNREAQARVRQVFDVVDCIWRGLGTIPASGLSVRSEYSQFDAEKRFELSLGTIAEPQACRAGEVLQGKLYPDQCEAFGRECSPDHPLGAPMVSSEGACAAYFNAGRCPVRQP